MKKQLFGFLLIFSFAFTISAQMNEAQKLDEFSSYTCEEMLYFLDIFGAKVFEAENSKGFIIVYEGKYSRFVPGNNNGRAKFLPKFGESAFRTREMRNYLINFRSFPKEKFLFVSGGFRENHTVELWIVPNGTTPPKASPTIKEIKYRKGKPEMLCTMG